MTIPNSGLLEKRLEQNKDIGFKEISFTKPGEISRICHTPMPDNAAKIFLKSVELVN